MFDRITRSLAHTIHYDVAATNVLNGDVTVDTHEPTGLLVVRW
jgi:hypothetical protein